MNALQNIKMKNKGNTTRSMSRTVVGTCLQYFEWNSK